MLARLAKLLQGLLSRFIAGAERRHPEALLEAEKENLRRQIAEYNQGLATHAGLCERLMAHTRRLEDEERDLHPRIAAHLRAGNRDAAAQLALRLQNVGRELEQYRGQLQQAEATYRELLDARDVAVEAARARLDDLRVRLDGLRLQRATAEMNEMAAGLVSSLGGSGDTLSRLHEMIERERQQAAGRGRVARDTLWRREAALRDDEARALAEQALAEFEAREAGALEAGPARPAALPSRTGRSEPD